MLLVPISACTASKAETLPDVLPDPSEAPVGAPAASERYSEPTSTPPAPDTAASYWPWSDAPAQQPPPVKPYQLPTLSGDPLNFRDRPAALVKAPAIDADAVYAYVLACFPEDSKWDLDINLRGQLANSGGSVLDTGGAGNTELGSSYVAIVAIVASMPLYSSTEINREKEREYTRRQNVAATVADFITAIASRNHAIREMALYRSLEARASLRVQQGIVEAREQVMYLEKVAGSQEALVKQAAKIMESRLKLAGMCDPINAPPINTWLKKVATVPLHDPRTPPKPHTPAPPRAKSE